MMGFIMTNIKKKIANRLYPFILAENLIDESVIIGENTLLKGVVLRKKIQIGKGCRLFKADLDGEIKVGNYSSLWGPNLSIRAGINPVVIGNFCSIARNVVIQEYNHDYKRFTTYFIERNLFNNNKHTEEIVSKGGITIAHDVWIGANSVVLSGSHISTGAVIAAGSVVNGYIPPYAIAAGSPAKVLKYRFEKPVRNKLLETEWWTWREEEIKEKMEYLKSITG